MIQSTVVSCMVWRGLASISYRVTVPGFGLLRSGLLVLVSMALAAMALPAQSLITTIAGTGGTGFGGDGGPATAAALNRPVYVHVDSRGALYIADENNQRVRRVDGAGIITTFAGNGAAAFAGDGGPATAASLNGVTGVCSDGAGNIYLNDTLNQRIRRVDPAGVISTFAGNGNAATSGDGGPATAAAIWLPIRCAVDASGVMYVAEQGGHRVRRIAGGAISTFAGTGVRGFSGEGGPATGAQLDNPTAVAVDYQGNVLISDQGNHIIRRVAPDGRITTAAGNRTAGFGGDGGPANSPQVQLNFPGGLATDQAGNLYFTDGPNHRVRRIDRQGTLRTIAGNGAGTFGGDGSQAQNASLNGAFGLALDTAGNLFVADTLNQRVRRVTPSPGVAPVFPANGVVNAGSFAPGVTPGGLATIFGTDLSPANGVVVTNQVPWPAMLNGVAVTVGGVRARLYSLATLRGQEQISFQVPFEANGSAVELTVENNNLRSNPVLVPLRAAQPGVFLIDGRNGAFLHADFRLVTAAAPAARGEVLQLYLTGLGAVTPAISTGEVAPSQEPLARTGVTPQVSVSGVNAELFYSGLAPGLIGVYQLNFRVPENASTGSVEVIVNANGVPSNAARLEVR